MRAACEAREASASSATPAAAGLLCERGHALTMLEAGKETPPYTGSYNCDSCKARGLAVPRLHCNPCKYDLCGACAATRSLNPAITALIARLSAGGDGTRAALAELKKIATTAANRPALVQAGAIPLLVAQLSSGDPIRGEAADSIGWLACTNDNKPLIVAAGALPRLVALTAAGVPAATQIPAAEALKFLASDKALRAQVVEAGAVPPLVALLDAPDKKLREHACVALAHISNSAGHAVIAASGGIPALIKVLAPESTDETLRAAGDALGWLVVKDQKGATRVMVDAGAVPALLKQFKAGVFAAAQATAIEAVKLLAADNGVKGLVASGGGIPLLVELLRSSSDARVRQHAALCIQRLAASEAICATIGTAGALTVLLDILRTAEAGGSKNAVRDALRVLAASTANAGAVAAAGGSEHINAALVAAGGSAIAVGVATPASASGGAVSGCAFDPAFKTADATLSEGNRKIAGTSGKRGAVFATTGLSAARGGGVFEFFYNKGVNGDESILFGFGVRPAAGASWSADYESSPNLWLVRAYNGQVYPAKSKAVPSAPKIHEGSVVRFKWNPTSGEVSMAINNTSAGVVFKDIGAGAFPEIFPVIAAYGTDAGSIVAIVPGADAPLCAAPAAVAGDAIAEFDASVRSENITLLSGNKVMKATSGVKAAVYGRTALQWASGGGSWTFVYEEDVGRDEVACMGFGTKPALKWAYDASDNLWVIRAYNGALYGPSGKAPRNGPQLHKGSTIRFSWDARGDVTLAVDGVVDSAGPIFTGIRFAEIFPVVCTYGTTARVALAAVERGGSGALLASLPPLAVAFDPSKCTGAVTLMSNGTRVGGKGGQQGAAYATTPLRREAGGGTWEFNFDKVCRRRWRAGAIFVLTFSFL